VRAWRRQTVSSPFSRELKLRGFKIVQIVPVDPSRSGLPQPVAPSWRRRRKGCAKGQSHRASRRFDEGSRRGLPALPPPGPKRRRDFCSVSHDAASSVETRRSRQTCSARGGSPWLRRRAILVVFRSKRTSTRRPSSPTQSNLTQNGDFAKPFALIYAARSLSDCSSTVLAVSSTPFS
jgi:hypothetical protein